MEINSLKTKATFPEFLLVTMRKHTAKFKFPISLFVFSVFGFGSLPLRAFMSFVHSAKALVNNSFCSDSDKLSFQLVKICPLEPWLGQSQPMMLIRRVKYFTTYKVNWRSIAGLTVHFVFNRGPQYQDIVDDLYFSPLILNLENTIPNSYSFMERVIWWTHSLHLLLLFKGKSFYSR